jgi:hypothetical protein
MRSKSGPVWLGFLGGVLITAACGDVAACLSFYVWSRHMFIFGIQWPKVAFVLVILMVLASSGAGCLVLALRRDVA